MAWGQKPFEPDNPLRSAELLRQRIHFIGFYPHLIAAEEAARQLFGTYPLAFDTEARRHLAYRPKSLWVV